MSVSFSDTETRSCAPSGVCVDGVSAAGDIAWAIVTIAISLAAR